MDIDFDIVHLLFAGDAILLVSSGGDLQRNSQLETVEHVMENNGFSHFQSPWVNTISG